MSIQENNKLIAEFMEIEMFGEEKDHTEALLICSALDLSVNPCTHFENVQETVHLDDMKFDSSWDWLMPVVDKIQEEYGDGEEHISIQPPNTCSLTPFRGALYKSFYGKTTKQATYEAVVEFIKWHEERKTKRSF